MTDKSKSYIKAKFMNSARQTQIEKQTDSKADRQIKRLSNRQSDRQ